MIHYFREIKTAGPVAALAFSADGALIASATNDVVTLTVADSGERVVSIGTDNVVTGLALSTDKKLLAVATGAPTVRVYDCATGETVHKFIRLKVVDFLRDQKQLQVEFFPNSPRVITRGEGSDVTIWNCDSDEWEHLFRMPHRNGFIVMSPDGKQIAVLSEPGPDVYRGQVTIYRMRDGLQTMWNTSHASQKGARCGAFSPDDSRLASSVDGDGMRVWDVATGKPLAHIEETKQGPYSCVAFIGDAKHLLTTAARTLQIVRISDQLKLAAETSRQPAEIRGMAASADGTRIVTFNDNEALDVWNIQLLNNNTRKLDPKG